MMVVVYAGPATHHVTIWNSVIQICVIAVNEAGVVAVVKTHPYVIRKRRSKIIYRISLQNIYILRTSVNISVTTWFFTTVELEAPVFSVVVMVTRNAI